MVEKSVCYLLRSSLISQKSVFSDRLLSLSYYYWHFDPNCACLLCLFCHFYSVSDSNRLPWPCMQNFKDQKGITATWSPTRKTHDMDRRDYLSTGQVEEVRGWVGTAGCRGVIFCKLQLKGVYTAGWKTLYSFQRKTREDTSRVTDPTVMFPNHLAQNQCKQAC